jgi:hypothetical protein
MEHPNPDDQADAAAGDDEDLGARGQSQWEEPTDVEAGRDSEMEASVAEGGPIIDLLSDDDADPDTQQQGLEGELEPAIVQLVEPQLDLEQVAVQDSGAGLPGFSIPGQQFVNVVLPPPPATDWPPPLPVAPPLPPPPLDENGGFVLPFPPGPAGHLGISWQQMANGEWEPTIVDLVAEAASEDSTAGSMASSDSEYVPSDEEADDESESESEADSDGSESEFDFDYQSDVE